ncbi:hypothetical protein K466DRAFT_662500 [Polyporus arcularius HHB13444]|uniref:Uncharacterized protein n=1 Tax=Polyporus arcularius HHB13444 TaxID=1314778 RepID=A0A5C3PJ17_9APHY|nr:hypothetical protein K466DRAFT_662500 [Polyporus arcularius HHB13444]
MPYDDDDYNDNDLQDNYCDDIANEATSPPESDGYNDANADDCEGDPIQDDQGADDWPQENQVEEQDADSVDDQGGLADSDNAEDEQPYPAGDHFTGVGEDAYVGVSEGPPQHIDDGTATLDDDSAAPDDDNAAPGDDNAAPDDDSTAPDDDEVSPAANYADLDVRLTGYGHAGEDSPSSSMYGSQPVPEPKGALNQYNNAQGGGRDPAPATTEPLGYGAGGDYAVNASQPYGQNWGGGESYPPANSTPYSAQDPRSYAPPRRVDTHPSVGSAQQPVQCTSSGSKNVNGGKDTQATESHNFMGDFLSQTGTAIQSGMVKGISNSAAQATEGLLKQLGGSFHLFSHKPVVPPTATSASASHTSRPPAAGSAGVKPRPAQAHSAPAGASATRVPVLQSSGPKPITGARPTSTGNPPAASKARPAPASPQNGPPAPSTQVAGGGGAPKHDSVAASTVKRSAGAEALPALRGVQQTK